VVLSEFFKRSCIDDAFSDAHLVQFLEVTLGVLRLALLVHLP
jgi:hypothetical protein